MWLDSIYMSFSQTAYRGRELSWFSLRRSQCIVHHNMKSMIAGQTTAAEHTEHLDIWWHATEHNHGEYNHLLPPLGIRLYPLGLPSEASTDPQNSLQLANKYKNCETGGHYRFKP